MNLPRNISTAEVARLQDKRRKALAAFTAAKEKGDRLLRYSAERVYREIDDMYKITRRLSWGSETGLKGYSSAFPNAVCWREWEVAA
jgi:hypothetical protein